MAARQKNGTLPNVPDNTVNEISVAAEQYETIRNQRQALLAKEIEANKTLVDAMRKHKRKAYRDDNYEPPLMVELSAKDPTIKAKVKREKQAADSGDD